MTFKLVIECTKDIDKLNIDFSDGSSVVKTNQKAFSKNADNILETDDISNNISQEVVKPPVINRENKEIKVADELQSLDI